jgi:uncharacterized membrane protein
MNMPFYPPKIVRFAQDTHGFVPNFMTPASTEKVATKTTRQEDSPEKKKKQETHTHPKQKIKTKQNLDFPQLFLLFLFFLLCCFCCVCFLLCFLFLVFWFVVFVCSSLFLCYSIMKSCILCAVGLITLIKRNTRVAFSK